MCCLFLITRCYNINQGHCSCSSSCLYVVIDGFLRKKELFLSFFHWGNLSVTMLDLCRKYSREIGVVCVLSVFFPVSLFCTRSCGRILAAHFVVCFFKSQELFCVTFFLCSTVGLLCECGKRLGAGIFCFVLFL